MCNVAVTISVHVYLMQCMTIACFIMLLNVRSDMSSVFFGVNREKKKKTRLTSPR